MKILKTAIAHCHIILYTTHEDFENFYSLLSYQLGDEKQLGLVLNVVCKIKSRIKIRKLELKRNKANRHLTMSMFHSHVDLISGWYLVFYVKRTPSCLSNYIRGKKIQCISSVFFPLLGDFWRKEGTELQKIYVVTKVDITRPSCSFARFFAHALPAK